MVLCQDSDEKYCYAHFLQLKVPIALSIVISEAPTAAGIPHAVAIMAAWETFVPVVVRIPRLAFIPLTSSCEVMTVTRIASSLLALAASASSGEKQTLPQAAPGEAAEPLAISVAALRIKKSIYAQVSRQWP